MKGKGSDAEGAEELEGQDGSNTGSVVTSDNDDDNGHQGAARPTSSSSSSSDRGGLDDSDEEVEGPKASSSSNTAPNARTRAGVVPPLAGFGSGNNRGLDTPREDLSGRISLGGDPR